MLGVTSRRKSSARSNLFRPTSEVVCLVGRLSAIGPPFMKPTYVKVQWFTYWTEVKVKHEVKIVRQYNFRFHFCIMTRDLWQSEQVTKWVLVSGERNWGERGEELTRELVEKERSCIMALSHFSFGAQKTSCFVFVHLKSFWWLLWLRFHGLNPTIYMISSYFAIICVSFVYQPLYQFKRNQSNINTCKAWRRHSIMLTWSLLFFLLFYQLMSQKLKSN